MEQNSLFKGILISLLLSVHAALIAQPYIPGNSYFGRNKYIEYIAGNLPLIISVPHGGNITSSEIPDRTCGDETVTDSYTISLANEIKDAVFKLTGCYPHIIICNLKRTKLDANRDLPEAACGNEYSGIAWNEFQSFIDSASANVIKKSGKGLYIDLHGHGHTIQRLELGYLLSATQLRYSNATLNAPAFTGLSSIRNLINSNITNFSHSDLIRGTYSLGSMFAAQGFPAVPSSDDRYPLSGQSYFTGGYNSERHGSNTSGSIDGIQIECNQDVRFNEMARQEFATRAAAVLLEFLIKHYFPQLSLTYCKNSDAEQSDLPGYLVFPNPFGNFISFQNPGSSELVIYDYQGKIVCSKKIGPYEQIDLSYLKNGIYLINLTRNLKILYKGKIVK